MFRPGNRRKHVPLAERWMGLKAAVTGVVRRTWRIAAVTVGVVTLVGGGLAAWHRDSTRDHFQLQRIEVTGAASLPVEEIAATCGLVRGRTNLLFESASIIRNTCEADLRLRRATVEIEPPDLVRVAVEEQSPALYVATEHGLWAVNPYGEAYAPADMADLHDLPLLVGSASAPATDGTPFRDALALVRTVDVPVSPWVGQSLMLEYDDDLGFEVSASGRGLRARFGQGPFVRKFERLVEALDVAARQLLVVEQAWLDNAARPNAVTLRIALSGPLAQAGTMHDVVCRGDGR